MRELLLCCAVLLAPLTGLASVCGSENGARWYLREKDAEQTFGCTSSSCLGFRINVHQNGDWQRGVEMTLTNQDCRRKEDLGAVICPHFGLDETCSLFTSWGTRITSCSDLKPHDSVFLVPANQLVVLPVRETKTEIQHISLPNSFHGLLPTASDLASVNTIQMLTLSDHPRIVLFENIATPQEAIALRSYLESELPYYLQAHSSGVDEIDSVEVQGDTALALRKRIFDLLGVFPFDDGLAEPLVVMRINTSQALPVTRDYLERDDRRADLDAEHDYEKSNRFSTVLLILAKAEAGGDLFVPDLVPINSAEDLSGDVAEVLDEAQEKLLDAQVQRWGLSEVYRDRDSWPRRLLYRCYGSGASASLVPSRNLGGLVVYSQLPQGSPDPLSGYALCPVLKGQMWMAKLHIWNAGKHFNPHASDRSKPLAVSATFEARDVYGAKLYWEDQLWEELAPGRPIKVNTFAGHRWHVRLELDESPVVSWAIGEHSPSQRFVLTARDLPVFNF